MDFSDCSSATAASGTPLRVYFSSAENISTDGRYLLNNYLNENDSSIARNVGFALVEHGTSKILPLNQAYKTNINGDKKNT